ncbi:hypothetical protein LWI28_006842 [Acer negundo]|uniref:Transmembrane protein n=1 Tax=Acer negundo TaxID=4023 RepID=A0AAD5J8N7_ACENE|nr:hypothetical protein LWI28_006842 [Acer negundo]
MVGTAPEPFPYLQLGYTNDYTERVDPPLPFVLATYPKENQDQRPMEDHQSQRQSQWPAILSRPRNPLDISAAGLAFSSPGPSTETEEREAGYESDEIRASEEKREGKRRTQEENDSRGRTGEDRRTVLLVLATTPLTCLFILPYFLNNEPCIGSWQTVVHSYGTRLVYQQQPV